MSIFVQIMFIQYVYFILEKGTLNFHICFNLNCGDPFYLVFCYWFHLLIIHIYYNMFKQTEKMFA